MNSFANLVSGYSSKIIVNSKKIVTVIRPTHMGGSIPMFENEYMNSRKRIVEQSQLAVQL